MVVAAAKFKFFDRLSVDPHLTDLDVRIGWRILSYFNASKGYAWPGIRALAEEVHSAPRSVIRSINRMVEQGWFLKQRGGGRGRSSRYAPVFSKASPPVGLGLSADDSSLFSPRTQNCDPGGNVSSQMVTDATTYLEHIVTEDEADSFTESIQKTSGSGSASRSLSL